MEEEYTKMINGPMSVLLDNEDSLDTDCLSETETKDCFASTSHCRSTVE